MPKLFVDTHSEKVTLALIEEDKIFEKNAFSNRSHSEVVVPLLDDILKEAGCDLAKLDEIVVVNGPGSFTGVRIGVTVAKTIAYSHSIPIKVISSLEMFGESAEEYFDLVTVEDAKGVYSAHRVDGEYTDFIYQRRQEFEEYVSKNGFTVLENKKIDYQNILAYVAKKETINPHLVTPIYIKEIDALK